MYIVAGLRKICFDLGSFPLREREREREREGGEQWHCR